MPTPTVAVLAIAASVTYAVTLLMQLIKPLVELLPGLMLPKNRAAHDSLLRLLLVAANFGGLLFAAAQSPGPFTGWTWWGLLGLAAGQALAGHASYQAYVSGKQDKPPVLS